MEYCHEISHCLLTATRLSEELPRCEEHQGLRTADRRKLILIQK